jgi:hypothetical protein
VTSVVHLRGPLDHQAATDAFKEIARRHPIFRSRFVPAGPAESEVRAEALRSFASSGVFQPGSYQQCPSDAEVPIAHVDLSGVAEPGQRAYIEREAALELDHATDPLLRITFLRTGVLEHLLILVIDHLISDAWSIRNLRREFIETYSRIIGGSAEPDNSIPLSFDRYIERQHEMAATGGFSRSLDYWRRQWSLFGPARIGFDDLPYALPRPEKPASGFASEALRLDPETSAEIRATVRRRRVTLYVFFLSAFASVLHRHTGRNRLAVWGHFANRSLPQFRDSIGWFATTHLLGIDAGEPQAPKDLLQAVHATVLDAAEHQEVPIALLWRALGAYPRDPDAKVLLDLNVAVDLPPVRTGQTELTALLRHDLTPSFGRFSSLGIYLRDDRRTIEIAVQYSSDRFSAADMRQLIGDFTRKVGEFVATCA